MICIRNAVLQSEAAYIFELLSANQIHCLVESYRSSDQPLDLKSSGMRKILVSQEDQAKAERLLVELTPINEVPEEYDSVGLGSKRRHLLDIIAERFFPHKPRSN
jgi:hypothetical protein